MDCATDPPLLCLIRFALAHGEKQQKSKQPVAPISIIFYGLHWWNKHKKYTYWTHNNTTNVLFHIPPQNFEWAVPPLPPLTSRLGSCVELCEWWTFQFPWNLQSIPSSFVGFWRGLDITHWQWEHVTHELKN